MSSGQKLADLPKHWDSDHQPTHAELEEGIALPEGVGPEELLRRFFNHKPKAEHVEYWREHGGDEIL